jgi:sugar O-acyltransferase (sialic acid O-acetyltransferase NeuD family)
MKDLVIFGAGGLGKEIAWLVENINDVKKTWNIIGFIDDGIQYENVKSINGYKFLGDRNWLENTNKEIFLIFAIGKSTTRKLLFDKFADFTNIKYATIIDTSVKIDMSVNIGEGSIICRNTSITVNTTIGDGVLLNINSLIGHDSTIGNFCTFSPHAMAAGETTIGDLCEIGSGAFIMQGIKVINNTIIAPLSAIYKDINIPGTYSGNPARQMR